MSPASTSTLQSSGETQVGVTPGCGSPLTMGVPQLVYPVSSRAQSKSVVHTVGSPVPK